MIIDIKEEYIHYLTCCLCSENEDLFTIKIDSYNEFKEKHLQENENGVKYRRGEFL